MSKPDCPCSKESAPAPAPAAPAPAAPTPAAAPTKPARSGACRLCLRKHILKALGYAEELAEDVSRAWELDRLFLNLMLAEDHAAALDDVPLRSSIRAARLRVENGEPPEGICRKLYEEIRK